MMKMVPNRSESPPCKKLRLGHSKPDIHTPLHIETDRARSVRVQIVFLCRHRQRLQTTC